MNEIGEMIRAEAIKEGEAKGKTDMLIRMLIKKFKKLPDQYFIEIRKLSVEAIEVIAIDIFEIEKVEDLESYL